GFHPEKVAAFDDARIAALLSDPGIVRNRLKIEGAVQNARAFLKVKEEFGSFAAYIWRFVDGAPRQNAWRRQEDVPAQTPESQAMSRDLYRRGFRFVGPTICYAFMQAVGMVNDHIVTCFRHIEVAAMAARLRRVTSRAARPVARPPPRWRMLPAPSACSGRRALRTRPLRRHDAGEDQRHADQVADGNGPLDAEPASQRAAQDE